MVVGFLEKILVSLVWLQVVNNFGLFTASVTLGVYCQEPSAIFSPVVTASVEFLHLVLV